MDDRKRRAAWAEINLGRIVENYRALRKLAPDSKLIAAIKADAYGHGAVRIAWELAKEGADYLGIATVEEAAQLRAAGIGLPVVMLGSSPRDCLEDIIDLHIIPTITTVEDARLLSETAAAHGPSRNIEVMAAVETGMGRLGFWDNEDSLSAIGEIASMGNIKILGLQSHFAQSDAEDPSYSLMQIGRFNAFREKLAESGLTFGFSTMSNSGAIANYPQAAFEAVRPGLSLYGLYPSPFINTSRLPLKPAMSIKANLVYLRHVPAGASVSYGSKFTTQRDSLIAVLPLGYADGLPRAISGKGRILVRGRFAPIVGAICMDQCMADLTDIPEACEYDEAVVMGSQDGAEITAEEIAERSGSINYEVVCRFGQRLPKVFYDGPD